ncbi:MAG: hypothetical protein KDB02_14520 [Acidimicrobiales bacterium]|nr:hypothetical protein [Acidimicrobiales bacterium]
MSEVGPTGPGGVEEIVDDEVTWRFDVGFLRSNWTCTWGRGCLGILDHAAPELKQGCCSVGAQIDGDEEARRVAGLAATLEPQRFQFHETATVDGIYEKREGAPNTRIVDGACIFLNRPGFEGGEGCALHLAALADGESPIDWKPSVCWQLPVKVDWSDRGDGGEVAHVRAWTRADWGDDGDPMYWCCTTDEGAYVGDRPVVESLAEELEAIVGTEVYVQLRGRIASGRGSGGSGAGVDR